MRRIPLIVSISLVPGLVAGLSAGCGRASSDDEPDSDPGVDAAVDGSGIDGTPAERSLVYAHSGQRLYRIETSDLEVIDIGPFGAALGNASITDIAIDKDDRVLGVTLDKVYEIDITTGQATLLTEMASSAPNLTSLSFVPVDLDDPDGEEILVAAADDGTVFSINEDTGEPTTLGSYGTMGDNVIRSSGDIVAVRGVGILATVDIETLPDDFLAVIDPVSWTAHPIGTGTGFDRIFGVGYWRGKVYGFVDRETAGGSLVELNLTTGAGSLIENGTIRWYGAGVTTDAPIVE